MADAYWGQAHSRHWSVLEQSSIRASAVRGDPESRFADVNYESYGQSSGSVNDLYNGRSRFLHLESNLNEDLADG
jgi:hypothetical protein